MRESYESHLDLMKIGMKSYQMLVDMNFEA